MEKQCFIIASPRSGTTWLNKALDAHPNIFSTERRLFGNYSDHIQDEGVALPRLRCTLDKFVSASLLPQNMNDEEGLLRAYIQALLAIEKKHSNARVTIDKITPYVESAEQVHYQLNKYFPKAPRMYLVRDGRDVCTSGVFHWFNKIPVGHEVSDFERERNAFFTGGSKGFKQNRFFTDAEITEWAKTWLGPVRLSGYEIGPQKKIIRYEDMLHDLAAVLTELFGFMGLKTKADIMEQCLDASSFKAMSGREQGDAKQGAHVRKGISGDWKNYFTRRDGELFHEIAGEELISAGYEADDAWVSALPEVINVG